MYGLGGVKHALSGTPLWLQRQQEKTYGTYLANKGKKIPGAYAKKIPGAYAGIFGALRRGGEGAVDIGKFLGKAGVRVLETGRFMAKAGVWTTLKAMDLVVGAGRALTSNYATGILGAVPFLKGPGRYIAPALIAGGFLAFRKGTQVVNAGAGYSMDSPLVAHGYNPGISEPYPTLMEGRSWTGNALNATGGLALALHNRRRG